MSEEYENARIEVKVFHSRSEKKESLKRAIERKFMRQIWVKNDLLKHFWCQPPWNEFPHSVGS